MRAFCRVRLSLTANETSCVDFSRINSSHCVFFWPGADLTISNTPHTHWLYRQHQCAIATPPHKPVHSLVIIRRLTRICLVMLSSPTRVGSELQYWVMLSNSLRRYFLFCVVKKMIRCASVYTVIVINWIVGEACLVLLWKWMQSVWCRTFRMMQFFLVWSVGKSSARCPHSTSVRLFYKNVNSWFDGLESLDHEFSLVRRDVLRFGFELLTRYSFSLISSHLTIFMKLPALIFFIAICSRYWIQL